MHCPILMVFAEFVRVQETRMVRIYFARTYASAVCFEESVLPQIHFNCKFALLLFFLYRCTCGAGCQIQGAICSSCTRGLLNHFYNYNFLH